MRCKKLAYKFLSYKILWIALLISWAFILLRHLDFLLCPVHCTPFVTLEFYFRSNDSSFNFKSHAANVSANNTNFYYETSTMCLEIPFNYKGAININKNVTSLQEVEKSFPDIEPGGIYRPKECKAKNSLAIIVAYRNRYSQLCIFLNHIHKFLMVQQLDYQIFVVEQDSGKLFNKGRLLNAGFVEALKRKQFDCVIFHDVDMLPEDIRNIYKCLDMPRHLTVAIDIFNYELFYENIFGGATAFTIEHFKLINGFSNQFWAWGSEDDDLFSRVKWSGLKVLRSSPEIARYTALDHPREARNPKRWWLTMHGEKRYKKDGLSDLEYERKDIQFKKLFTWILIDFPTSPKYY